MNKVNEALKVTLSKKFTREKAEHDFEASNSELIQKVSEEFTKLFDQAYEILLNPDKIKENIILFKNNAKNAKYFSINIPKNDPNVNYTDREKLVRDYVWKNKVLEYLTFDYPFVIIKDNEWITIGICWD